MMILLSLRCWRVDAVLLLNGSTLGASPVAYWSREGHDTRAAFGRLELVVSILPTRRRSRIVRAMQCLAKYGR